MAGQVTAPAALPAVSDRWSTIRSKFLAGSSSGIVCGLLLQPFDVVRTKQQGYHSDLRSGGRALRAFDVAQHVVREDGVSGLWRGLNASLARLFFGTGIYFSTLEYILSIGASGRGESRGGSHVAMAGKQHSKSKTSQQFVAGAAARSIAGTILMPLTVVKTRMEWGAGSAESAVTGGSEARGLRAVRYRSVGHALSDIVKVEGYAGLFSGLGVTLMRDAPYSGLYVVAYTQLKRKLEESSLSNYIAPTGLHLLAGSTGALLATTVTHPFDVLRTRAQMVPREAGGKHKYTVWQVYKEEGLRSFSRGFLPRISKRATQTALVWTIYEEVVKRLQARSVE